MDENTILMVAIGLLCVIQTVMRRLFTRRIDELRHDLEQLKVDSQSHTYGLRTVTCAVANLEMQMEGKTQHESHSDLPTRRP